MHKKVFIPEVGKWYLTGFLTADELVKILDVEPIYNNAGSKEVYYRYRRYNSIPNYECRGCVNLNGQHNDVWHEVSEKEAEQIIKGYEKPNHQNQNNKDACNCNFLTILLCKDRNYDVRCAKCGKLFSRKTDKELRNV